MAAGMSIDDRRRHRYTTLVDVGTSLLGAPAGPAVSVRAVCRAAKLTERYFYESFTDRDQFVRAVYAQVGERARASIEDAVENARGSAKAEAPVRAFVELVLDDPAAGRVLLLAPLSEPALGGSGAALVPGFVELVRAQLVDMDDDDAQLVAVGVVGALTALFAGYLDGTVTTPREKFVAHCVELVSEAGRESGSRVP
jgi:AcrR family transcriptional regulator